MVRYFLNPLFVFLMLSTFAFAAAKYDDTKLQAEFGKDLTKAPFYLRYAYTQKFNRDWGKTDYAQREAFLKDYEINLAKNQAKQRAEAKAEALKERQEMLEKKYEDIKDRAILKDEEAQDKEQEQEDAQRQKDFDSALRDQQRELEQMQRQAQGI
jgi:hypothetical protein